MSGLNTNRVKKINALVDDIDDNLLEGGNYFMVRDDSLPSSDPDYHIDSKCHPVKKGAGTKYRKVGDYVWHVELQQANPDKDTDKGSKKKDKSFKAKSKSAAKGLCIQKSGFGNTFGGVHVVDKLKENPPHPAAFKAAMKYSCQNADTEVQKINGRWVGGVKKVLFLEDRSWVDEHTDERHEEKEYINKKKE